MFKKKLEAVRVDKRNKKIYIKEHPSKFALFFKKYNKMFLLLTGVSSVAMLAVGLVMAVSSVPTSDKLVIKEVSIDTDLNLSSSDVTSSMGILTDETAKEMFQNSSKFKKEGEALLVKTVSKGKYIIRFYSDYTAVRVMKNGGSITRINAIDDSKYGISENGVTNSKADILDVKKTKEEKYKWGNVIYYSDGSAEITNSDINMFVRNANDVMDKYVSLNKVSYLKNTSNNAGVKISYYYDGTVHVVKNNKDYLVRDINDLNITSNDVTFKNDNIATIYKNIKMSNGIKIDYYTDGGAIITEGNRKISVRKSNSIIIKEDKIFEIVDNIYVEVSNRLNNGNIVYYTNGSAVLKNYNGKTVYVEDNSTIKNNNGNISGFKYEILSDERKFTGENIKVFVTVGVIETDDYIAIVPKDKILYDTDGSLREILSVDNVNDNKPITITNNTNSTIKYRLVIDRSVRSNLDTRYIKYQVLASEKYVGPNKLSESYWNTDKVHEALGVSGNNYVLVERILEPQETDTINVMFWIDYDTIPNSMQNKRFYGTLRIYAWQELEAQV